MKPEKGPNEMEEKMFDPQELFTEIALLITEARIPDMSPKGRIEGPHCPPAKGVRYHECDRHKLQCRRASDLASVQEVLWVNQIPMRIDVLLFPDCEHGYREEVVIEGATFSCEDDFLLLERWDVQLVKKRSSERLEGFVNGRTHLQMIQSYLHFSQLSSWLISTQGCLPARVVYRIYAPGEAVGYSFSHLPVVHSFPSAELDFAIMQSSVAHLPRQEKVASLRCRTEPGTDEKPIRQRKTLDESKIKRSKPKFENSNNPVPSTSKLSESEGKNDRFTFTDKNQTATSLEKKNTWKSNEDILTQKPPIGRKNCEDKKSHQSRVSVTPCPMSHTPKRKVDQLSPTMKLRHEFPESSSSPHTNPPCSSSCDIDIDDKEDEFLFPCSSSTPTNVQQKHNAETDTVKSKHEKHELFKSQKCLKPNSLSVSTNNNFIGTKRLPSPKVIVSGSKKPDPSIFKKRCIDLNLTESKMENLEDMMSVPLKPVEEFTSSDLHDLIKPLYPSDLEAFLSSLSQKAPRVHGSSKLEDIPTTKCSFYIEEDADIDSEKRTPKRPQENSKYPDSCNLIQSLSNGAMQGSEMNSKSHRRNLFENFDSDSNSKDSIVTTDGKTKKFQNGVKDTSVELNISLEKSFNKYSGNTEGTVLSQPVCVLNKNSCMITEDSVNVNSQRDLTVLPRKTFQNLTQIPSNSREVMPNEMCISSPKVKRSNDVSHLAENLESMDIDESSHCVLDQEVAHHFSEANMNHLNSLSGDSIDDCKTPTNDTFDMEICDKKSVTDKLACAIDGNRKSVDSVTARKTETKVANSCASPTPNSSTCDQKLVRDLSLCKQLLQREFQHNMSQEMLTKNSQKCHSRTYKSLPSPDDIKQFQFVMGRSTSAVFNSSTGLPSRSSPAPLKKRSSTHFDYDCSLTNIRSIKNAMSCSKLSMRSDVDTDSMEDTKVLSTSAPASTNCLLGNFEESVLNGRIEPVGVVQGFTVEIGASGSFCPRHVTLPVVSYFFQLSDDNAPSPYLGYVNLEPLGKRGYHVPRSGTVQVTLFNPNRSVVKMFVVMYDLSDMPPNCQTFLRQRTMYMSVKENSSEPSYLRYLIHLRFQSRKSGKIYLHTDLRLIFARDKFEFDPRVGNYELRSFTEGPENPKFSPKR